MNKYTDTALLSSYILYCDILFLCDMRAYEGWHNATSILLRMLIKNIKIYNVD